MKSPLTVTIAVSVLLLMLYAPPGAAEQQLKDHPGFFAIDDMKVFASEDITVDINLFGAMLRMIAAVDKDNSDFGELVSGLKRIRVRIGSLHSGNEAKVRAGIAKAITELAAQGWEMIVRTREDGEEVSLFVRESDDEIEGLTLFLINGDQAVLINIVGAIDPELIGELPMLEDLDLDDLGS